MFDRFISSEASCDSFLESAESGDLLAALLDNLFKAAASSKGLAFLGIGEGPRGDGDPDPSRLDSVGD